MSKNILQAEESLQNALESLRSLPTNPQISAILSLLAPKGYHPVVVLQENGRKKRRTASLSNWSPDTGEILISFSKDSQAANQSVEPAPEVSASQHRTFNERMKAVESQPRTPSAPEVRAAEGLTPEIELCHALEEVERQGRSFVALKWFRDDVLPSKGFEWAMDPDERQSVMARAIESGAVLTSKIPNPRSPFPTTTIRLNRSRATGATGGRRFSPIRVSGESLSATILRDRGVR